MRPVHAAVAASLLQGTIQAVSDSLGGLRNATSDDAGSKAHHNAIFMGLIYGFVHVVGPDHLGTLMTLSSVTSRARAFKVGAAWGLGHSFGMVFIAAVFIGLRRLVRVNIEMWEYYGNYFIGASMMLCAIYFISYEGSFVKEQADGTFVAQPCACHGPALPASAPRRLPGERTKGTKFCSAYCSAPEDDGCGCHEVVANVIPPPGTSSDQGDCQHPEDEEAGEDRPLINHEPKQEQEAEEESSAGTWWERAWAERDTKGALLGVLQGVCCPLGMVGMTFLAGLQIPEMVGFLVTFMLVSAFGTATVAVLWAFLTEKGCGTGISPRAVYRASCCFTFFLGGAWIIANLCGALGWLDYTEHMHHHAETSSGEGPGATRRPSAG